MIEEITVFKDKNYILVKSNGKPNLQDFRSAIDKIIALSTKHDITKVLVDSRQREQAPSISDLYMGGEYLAEYIHGNIHFAILVQNHDQNHQFFKNVTSNRGTTISFFEDEDDAINWLGSL